MLIDKSSPVELLTSVINVDTPFVVVNDVFVNVNPSNV